MQDDYGVSALFIAIQKGHIEMNRELIAKGAKIDLQDDYGVSAFYIASQ